jgi:hypothetical protein
MHVCSQVCCITYRADVASTLCYILAIWLYIRAVSRCSRNSDSTLLYRAEFVSALCVGVVAMLFKEQGVTVFGLFMVYEALLAMSELRLGRDCLERVWLTVLVLVCVMIVRLRLNFGPAPR